MVKIKIRRIRMKKRWMFCVFVLVSIPCLMAQQAQSITDVITDTVTNYLAPLGGKGQAGEKVLVLHFKAPTGALNDWAIDRFTEAFKQRGLVPVERQNWSDSLAAVGERVNAALDDASAASLGAQAGVKTVFTGTFAPQDKNWALAIRAVSVAGKKSVWSKNYLIRPGETFTRLATPGPAAASAPAAAAPAPAAPAPAPAAPAAVPAPAPAASRDPVLAQSYRIGASGPAGGLIFYDKGDNSGGWQYLEAAPVETEQTVTWGPAASIRGLTAGIGAGKKNTETIMDHQRESGQLYRAAQICDALVVGGFNDWYLPSKSELVLMFTNLKDNDLGGFRSGWYWSSTSESQYYAWTQLFGDGSQDHRDRGNTYSVRAVRQF
jgi:hypothetical protein